MVQNVEEGGNAKVRAKNLSAEEVSMYKCILYMILSSQGYQDTTRTGCAAPMVADAIEPKKVLERQMFEMDEDIKL